MEILFNAVEFCDVPEKQREYFKKVTMNCLKDGNEVKNYKSHPRRLFDSLSEIIFREGMGHPKDVFGKPLENPTSEDFVSMIIQMDWPRNDFRLVCEQYITVSHRIVESGFGKYRDGEYFYEDPAALYRNIRHLIAVIDCYLRGKERLYRFYC